MNYIFFFLFFFILFFLGRGLLILIDSFNNISTVDKKIFGVNSYIFYPSISLFFLGNISVLFNFIFPLKIVNKWIFLFAGLILFVNFLNIPKIFSKDFLIVNFFIPGVMNVTSYNIWLHYDAGLYHLNNQKWINESEIIFGLGNLNIWFSWSSIYEYISAFFWLDDNFLLLHFINIIFFILFFSFLYFQINQNQSKFLKFSSLNLILFGIIDNFGINGGGNGFLYVQTVGKPDVSFSVIFYITFILLINSFIENDFSIKNLKIFLYLSLFSIQLKIFGFYLVPILLIYFYKLGSPFIIFKKLKTFFAISFLWIIKNFIISGCFFFPVEITCSPIVSWYERGRANFARSVLFDQHIAYNFGDSIQEWFSLWINHGKNTQIYTNFLISILLLALVTSIFFKKSNPVNGFNSFWIRLYQFSIVFTWFLSAPNSRFGMIVCLILISTLSFKHLSSNQRFKIFQNSTLTGLLFVCIILTPRFYSYQSFFDEPFKLSQIETPEQTYINSKNGWAVIPANGDNRCWVNLKCMDIERYVYPENLNSYKIFKSES